MKRRRVHALFALAVAGCAAVAAAHGWRLQQALATNRAIAAASAAASAAFWR